MLRIFAAAAMAGGLSLGAPAVADAQDVDPEQGGMWVPAPAEDETGGPDGNDSPGTGATAQGDATWTEDREAGTASGQRGGTTPTPNQAAGSAAPAAEADERSDHRRVVGRLAVGYMGLTAVPIGDTGVGAPSFTTVSAPALGVRYWISELIGIDVGLGVGFLGGNSGDGTTSAPIDNAFAMTVHAGVPLALFHASHYKLLIVPEVNLGFSTGTHFGPTSNLDRGRDGLLLQIGGRIGTEIHFGFMDIPQLSLQASIGLYFEYASTNVGPPSGGGPSEVHSRYGVNTSVMGEPWDILLGALNALYYF